MADVRAVAGTAHAAAAALNATATITIGGIVQAAAEVVRAPETTVADLQALADTLQTAAQELARQRAENAAAESPGLALSTYRWYCLSARSGPADTTAWTTACPSWSSCSPTW